MAQMGREEPVKYECRKPWTMPDREIINMICDAGMWDNACRRCQLCEFGKEYIKRGLDKDSRNKRRR